MIGVMSERFIFENHNTNNTNETCNLLTVPSMAREKLNADA